MREPTGKRPAFLSTLPARRSDRRLATAVVLLSLTIFLVVLPFAGTPLPAVLPFIPAYESAFAIIGLITATLLYAQFAMSASPAFLLLASGYLFSALMAVPHALTFPGLLAPTGMLRARTQSTAWLHLFWHAGLPLAVIGYSALKQQRRESDQFHFHSRYTILLSIAVVVAVVAGLTWLATTGEAALPAIMQGNGYLTTKNLVILPIWLLSVVALLALWRRVQHTVLDLWLMVVMWAWTLDMALGAVVNAGRFDLGFYVGRIYGLVAASFVLIMLLLEAGVLYARLARSVEMERRGQAIHLRAVETARDAAVSADRAKSRFLATASHDLRQPLHAMNLFISALRRRVAGDEAMRLVEGMAAATESMQAMFNSLLDVSKLDAGAIKPSLSDFAIEQLLMHLRAAFAGSAAAKALVLNIPVAKAVVHSDPALLESILRNLLSNAVRYTRRGEVSLLCHAHGDLLVIEVRDTGPGIPADQHDAIFEEFRRLDTAGASERGLGLGLAIVRRLANLLDISVTLESELGRGSVFRVQVAQARWDDVVVGEAVIEPAALAGRRVLLVDDHKLVRDALTLEIADWGAETIVAGSVDEVFAALAASGGLPPEVAIVDRDLGDPLSGPQLLDAIRQRFGVSIPGVIVTGATDPDTIDALRRSGYPWITKPIDVGMLRGIVDELLPVRRGQSTSAG